jgi:hypothetical protein
VPRTLHTAAHSRLRAGHPPGRHAGRAGALGPIVRMRGAPPNRIVSPLSLGFSTVCTPARRTHGDVALTAGLPIARPAPMRRGLPEHLSSDARPLRMTL